MGMAATNGGSRSLRLIIIDSDHQSRRSIRDYVRENNLRIIGEAEDAKSGVRLVKGLQPDLVLMELPPASDDVMDAVKRIRDELPDTGIILSAHNPSPQLILSCIRAGAQEFITRPIERNELNTAVNHVRKLYAKSIATSKKRGIILSVFASKGGVGSTSVAANLGVALASNPETKIVLVDLSFHMGDLGLMLDMPARYSLIDAFKDGELDQTKVASITSKHSSGAYLLTVATSPEISDEITYDHMAELMGTLGTMFDFIIVDIGRHLDDRTVEVLELSDGILMLAALDIPTIRNVNRYLDIFDRLEISREKTHIIVNRFQKKTRIGLKDLEEAIGMDTFWAIPNEYMPISLGIDSGNPVVIDSPRSKVAHSFRDLAARFKERFEETHSFNTAMTVEADETTTDNEREHDVTPRTI
jgi:pilus assembly protein CpaE